MAEARPAQPVRDAHLAGCQVADERWNEIRAHAPGALFVDDERYSLQVLEAADADPEKTAGAVALFFGQVERRLVERELARSHGEGDEARDFLHLLAGHE